MSVARIINTPAGFEDAEAVHAHAAHVAAPQPGPSSRVHNGAVVHVAGQHEAVQHGTASRQHGFDRMGTEGGSVMSTRQRVNGQDTVELSPGMPGSRTHIGQALRDGLIREVAAGVYEDARTADGAQRTLAMNAAEQQQAQPKPSSSAYSADEHALWGEALAGVPEAAVDAAVAGMAKAIASGSDLESVAQRLAQNTGMRPDEAAQRIEQAAQVQEAALERAMAQAGLQGEQLQAFYDAARANPARLTDALMHLVYGGDSSRFVGWGREFAGDTSRRAASDRASRGEQVEAPVFDEDTMRAAGFDTARTSSGVLMVKPRGTNGRWAPAADVLKG